MTLLDLLSDGFRAPAECVVQLGASLEEIEDLYALLVELSVDTARSDAATATLKFEARRDEYGEWTVQDADRLAPWEPIRVSARFGEDEYEVFRGFVREVKADYPEDAGNAVVTVECQDESMRFDRRHRRESWGTEEEPASDGAVITTILGEYGLSPHGDNGSGQSGLIDLSQDETDIRFLQARAEENGYELSFVEGEVYFGPMRLDAEPQPTILVYAGADSNCLSLNARTDGHQPDAVAFDVADEEGDGSTDRIVFPDLHVMGPTHATSEGAGLEEFVWRMSGEAGADAERLAAKAQRKANDFDIHKVTAEGELDGTLYGYVLAAGLPVVVDGLGTWLSGTYYVDAVTHVFTAEGYRQRFRLLRNAYGDNVDEVLGPSVLR